MAAPTGDPSDAAERRTADRLELLGDLNGEIMVFQPMVIREISAAGAQIDTPFPLHLESLHDLRLALGDDAVVVKGRVVHCRITDMDQELVSYRSGVEFVAPSERVRQVIERFADAVRGGRRPGPTAT